MELLNRLSDVSFLLSRQILNQNTKERYREKGRERKAKLQKRKNKLVNITSLSIERLKADLLQASIKLRRLLTERGDLFGEIHGVLLEVDFGLT